MSKSSGKPSKLDEIRALKERKSGRMGRKPPQLPPDAPKPSSGTFDRQAYQREYMRKWRASRKPPS